LERQTAKLAIADRVNCCWSSPGRRYVTALIAIIVQPNGPVQSGNQFSVIQEHQVIGAFTALGRTFVLLCPSWPTDLTGGIARLLNIPSR